MDDLGELLQTLTLYDRLRDAAKQAEEEEETPSLPAAPWGQARTEERVMVSGSEFLPPKGGAGTEEIGSASPLYGSGAEASPLRQAEEISRYFERDARRYG